MNRDKAKRQVKTLLNHGLLLIIGLAISVYEIYISVKALEIHLNDMGD